jgi:glutathione S-transferase
LGAKDVVFQKCDVDLRVKAEWHKEINGGLVPLLETPDGAIIFESAVIAEFASSYQGSKGIPVWPHEAKPGDLAASMKTAEMKL